MLVTSAKRFDFDRLKIPPDVSYPNVSATKMCVASPARENAHLPLSANVNNAKPLQPNAFLAPGLCQIRANTYKQNCHLQPRMLHKYMNAACRSNIRIQQNETDFVK